VFSRNGFNLMKFTQVSGLVNLLEMRCTEHLVLSSDDAFFPSKFLLLKQEVAFDFVGSKHRKMCICSRLSFLLLCNCDAPAVFAF